MRRYGCVVMAVALLCVGFPQAPEQLTGIVQAEERGTRARRSGRLDRHLRTEMRRAGVTALDPGPAPSLEKVALGQALFFDKELSGNRDIACATCHHPDAMTGDDLSLSYGTGAIGSFPFRELGIGREFIPRNAPEIFNRGSSAWHSQFWDSRVEIGEDGEFISPAGGALPPGLENVLAVQAMFPVTSRDEMRGAWSDEEDDEGEVVNELAGIFDDELGEIWKAITDRLLAIPGYQDLFAAAFPAAFRDSTIGFQHAANAIAAFEAAAFTFTDSPWDQYVDGDRSALSAKQKRGALLFFGKAHCASCHNGSLLTDQLHYNIGVPQLGPGKNAERRDLGRENVTGDEADRYAFRTPPLRNVAVTGPWMHNGAYTTLESAVRHHLDPVGSLYAYDASQLEQDLADTVLAPEKALVRTIDRRVKKRVRLRKAEFRELMAFLDALTSPSLSDMSSTVPLTVPSGLPVDGVDFDDEQGDDDEGDDDDD